jgi:hypothetical protein
MGRRFAVIGAALAVAATLGTAHVAGATGPSWKIQPTPNPTGAYPLALNGVSCTAATACTAVGDYGSSGIYVTLAERWNGSSWRIQPTPNRAGATFNLLNGVSCTAATACTAVGDSLTSAGIDMTLAERWNGNSWKIQPTPNSGATGSVLQGVSCTAANACTAVGYHIDIYGTSELTLAERWNGTSWAIQPTPNGALVTGSLFGVSCTAATACTAVGTSYDSSNAVTLAERWNGSSWRIQPTPNRAGAAFSYLHGVSCTAATACIAVGNYVNSSVELVALVERWNGSSWNIQPNPTGARPSNLDSVSCTAAAACTAVGDYVNSAGTFLTLAERWNGSTWKIQPTPNPAGLLTGVSCTAATACTAVGYYGNSAGTFLTLAERYS